MLKNSKERKSWSFDIPISDKADNLVNDTDSKTDKKTTSTQTSYNTGFNKRQSEL